MRPLHGGQVLRTQDGFDLETELIIMPEAPKAQARCRWVEVGTHTHAHTYSGLGAVNCYATSLL